MVSSDAGKELAKLMLLRGREKGWTQASQTQKTIRTCRVSITPLSAAQLPSQLRFTTAQHGPALALPGTARPRPHRHSTATILERSAGDAGLACASPPAAAASAGRAAPAAAPPLPFSSMAWQRGKWGKGD
jgi:hypothetical protein